MAGLKFFNIIRAIRYRLDARLIKMIEERERDENFSLQIGLIKIMIYKDRAVFKFNASAPELFANGEIRSMVR